MSQQLSLADKLAALVELRNDNDSPMTEWESNFVASIRRQVYNVGDTTALSGKQVDVIDKIFDRYAEEIGE